MVTWLENGTSGTYRRYSAAGVYPSGSSWDFLSPVFASAGTVDAQLVTRLQYGVPGFITVPYNTIKLTFSAGDIAANPTHFFTATCFIASAVVLPANPTVAQIMTAAFSVSRAVEAPDGVSAYFRTTPGDIFAAVYNPSTPTTYPWTENGKYWIALVPTHVASMALSPSLANDLPVGDPNVNGRAVSFWTNRTPAAPVITTPATQTTVFAGSEVTLTYRPLDPDRISSFPGDVDPYAFDDVAGVQIQYAPVPTSDNPTPTWIDLPIANTDASAAGRGWYMDQSATAPANDGCKVFWKTFSMKIRCGAVSLGAGMGILPSGNWQIRLRTFDYGHPIPTGVGNAPPLNQTDRLYTPSTYPAVNTSPWSTPIRLYVSEQVPKPVPTSPVENIATIEGTPITLVWQYRNTYVPPFAQSKRTVQIRRVGDPGWTSLVTNQSSSSNSLLVTGFPLVSGNQYQWRVQVTDASNTISAFSDIASFWVVPPPGSGGVTPLPSESIDGATLGCGTHRIEVYRKGGQIRVGELTGITHVDWSRQRDEISTAQIVVQSWDVDCGELLSELQTWAYEIRITRDNGYSRDRVWEGPITLLTYGNDKVTIDAKDVMGYAYRRIIKQTMSDVANGDTVTSRAARALMNAFAPSDPNVIAYLTVLASPNDAMQYRSLAAYSRTAYEEIDDMAANAGLDYTVVGRSILVWSTKNRVGLLPEFRDKDLGSTPIVSEYGMSMANRYVVSDGNGVWGEATRLDEFGNDETYGLVELLSSTWASETENASGTYTQAGLEKVRASFRESAERSIDSRYPPPVVVRVPDSTTLNPSAVVSIQHLVPGVAIPLRSTGTLRTVVATQKLDQIKVVEENGKPEVITLTLSPFASQDVEVEE